MCPSISKGERMTEVMERTRAEQLKGILLAEIDGEPSVNLPQLANRVVNSVIEDEEFVRDLVEQAVRPFVYNMGKRLMAKTRGESVIELGDEIVGRSEFEARARVVTHKFEYWMEHSDGRYVNFMEMRKEDLLEAARQREARASTELAIAQFEKMLASKLKKSEKVGERFTPSQLDEMWAKAHKLEEA